ncbi:MAG: ComF family protein [Leptonema sp. (in: bacteria)]
MWGFLFPSYCVYCGAETKNMVCRKCWRQFQKFKILHKTENRCSVCFHKLNSINHQCDFCQSRFLFFNKVYALYEYNSFTKKILLEWKYQNQREIYKLFLKDILKTVSKETPDRIGIIGSSKISKNFRNYNILEDIAKEVSYSLKIPFGHDIIKTKKTKQSQNKQINRFFDVLFSFELTQKISNINKYLIIEDTITTGATINEVSRLLKKQNVREVMIISIFMEEIKEGSLWSPLPKANKMMSL